MSSQCLSAKSGWFPGLLWLSSYLLLNLATGRQGLYRCALITKHTQTLFPQTDNFLLMKARAKILLSCHQDSWFISFPPSFHIFFPSKIPPDSSSPNGPCTPGGAFYSAEWFWQNHLCWSCIFSLWIIIIHFGMEGIGKPTTFPGSWRVHQPGCPPYMCHLCKVKEPQSSNRSTEQKDTNPHESTTSPWGTATAR